jgi:hypothetical protein
MRSDKTKVGPIKYIFGFDVSYICTSTKYK